MGRSRRACRIMARAAAGGRDRVGGARPLELEEYLPPGDTERERCPVCGERLVLMEVHGDRGFGLADGTAYTCAAGGRAHVYRPVRVPEEERGTGVEDRVSAPAPSGGRLDGSLLEVDAAMRRR